MQMQSALAAVDLLERLAKLDSPAVSDALDFLNLRGAVVGLRPLWDCPRIVGRAVTVKIVPVGLTRPEHHLAAPAVDQSSPGDVIVIDNAGRVDVSSWGGILTHAAQIKGVRGVIVDGAARDVDEMRELGFPAWARSGIQVTARNRIIQESFNSLIQVAGVQVRPGDLVLADHSGVCFIPQERAAEVIEAAERIVALEAEMVKQVHAGHSVVDVMAEAQFNAIHQDQGSH
ncbi:MAG: hypothetical protein QOF51_3220 [Chloroflexota bacterium]|jgi:regulator of RNase E activity RraA|nr:hypothetical protein [Chloroflexota bacterium]